MKTVKFQLINQTDNQPLPTIYECGILREEQSTDTILPVMVLSRKKSSEIQLAEDYRIQPRRIYRYDNGKCSLTYGEPKGKSWSQGSFFARINIISITES